MGAVQVEGWAEDVFVTEGILWAVICVGSGRRSGWVTNGWIKLEKCLDRF